MTDWFLDKNCMHNGCHFLNLFFQLGDYFDNSFVDPAILKWFHKVRGNYSDTFDNNWTHAMPIMFLFSALKTIPVLLKKYLQRSLINEKMRVLWCLHLLKYCLKIVLLKKQLVILKSQRDQSTLWTSSSELHCTDTQQ